MKLVNAAHKKFINAFTRSGDIESAIKESGVSKEKAKAILNRYKSIYEGFFERLGMSKESVIKEHIELIKNPIRTTSLSSEGELKTTYDNATKLRAIESYYKLIKAIEEPAINLSTTIYSGIDLEKERLIMEEINKNSKLQTIFMEHIEKLKQVEAKQIGS